MFFFSAFQFLWLAVFVLMLGVFISTFVKSARKERENDAAPRLTTEAALVAKRTQVQGDHARTTYFATFQFESGDRLELEIPHNQFGYLVEGDKGKLSFQGTRYLNFERM